MDQEAGHLRSTVSAFASRNRWSSAGIAFAGLSVLLWAAGIAAMSAADAMGLIGLDVGGSVSAIFVSPALALLGLVCSVIGGLRGEGYAALGAGLLAVIAAWPGGSVLVYLAIAFVQGTD